MVRLLPSVVYIEVLQRCVLDIDVQSKVPGIVEPDAEPGSAE